MDPVVEYPAPGPLLALVTQPGIREAGRSWGAPDGAGVTAVSLRYAHVGGRESGRYLDGSVRTYLTPAGEGWVVCESLATAHLREVLLANSAGGVAAVLSAYDAGARLEADAATEVRGETGDPAPSWEQVVVMIDDTRTVARTALHDGYEMITFRIGDRVASCVLSVYDSSDIDCSFSTITWPLPTAADHRPVADPVE
jgi:hypothetical protein